jgi:hypothetical protein
MTEHSLRHGPPGPTAQGVPMEIKTRSFQTQINLKSFADHRVTGDPDTLWPPQPTEPASPPRGRCSRQARRRRAISGPSAGAAEQVEGRRREQQATLEMTQIRTRDSKESSFHPRQRAIQALTPPNTACATARPAPPPRESRHAVAATADRAGQPATGPVQPPGPQATGRLRSACWGCCRRARSR